jgi:hypothetical protein
MNSLETILIRACLIGIPAITYILIDKKLLFSSKIQKKLKISTLLKLYTFIFIALISTNIIARIIAMAVNLTEGNLYIAQTIIIGILVALFVNIQKLIVVKIKK